MTTVGLPDTSTYTATELVSCLVVSSACAYGSKGNGVEALRARPAQSRFPSLWRRRCWFFDEVLTTVAIGGRYGPCDFGMARGTTGGFRIRQKRSSSKGYPLRIRSPTGRRQYRPRSAA